MSVILGSEIARLVFGYLQDEQLDEAATTFCKTSPYLVEEYDWLRRGYKSYKISDLCLVDIIREHCEIKYAVSQYIESMSPSVADELGKQQNLSGKIECILSGLSTENESNQQTSRKRTYSMISENSIEATQTNQLPGYEPARKERRLSKKLILRADCTPVKHSNRNSFVKPHQRDDYTSDNNVEEIVVESSVQNADKNRNETSQYPIFTETILENTQFQNVLVDNINRILESSTDRLEISEEGGCQGNDGSFNNNFSLQEQVKHAIDNIIMSTEKDPTFQQVLDEVVQHTACQSQNTRASSTPNRNDLDNEESVDVPVPLKERLRGRSQDKPKPNYNENMKSTKKKRQPKVEVISNEIVTGEISDLLQPCSSTSTSRQDNYVPLHHFLQLNSDRTMTTNIAPFSQDSVYVNLAPPFPIIRIDADTSMYVGDISMLNNTISSTSLAPGSIINIPTIDTSQPMQPLNNLLSNVIIKDINEVSQTRQIPRSDKVTPNVTKNMSQPKGRCLSTPRRQSHVRSLKFTSNEDLITENDKRNNDVNKSTLLDKGSVLNSSTVLNVDSDNTNTNTKSAADEVVQQQDSSDAIDFSKEFDEATVISLQTNVLETPKCENSNEKKTPEAPISEKKKPQTRKQKQKDLNEWNEMRQMNKGDWDNYLRQTVALSSQAVQSNKKERRTKKKGVKVSPKSKEPNASVESVNNSTTDIEAKLLEEALKSAKKTDKQNSTSRIDNTNSTKESNSSGQPKINLSPVLSAQGSDAKNTNSPNKRASGRKKLIQIKIPSAKKKFSKRRKVIPKSTTKKRCSVTQIDPEQSIDIDFISPIEHPKEIQHPIKRNVNLNRFLETPCKDDGSFKFPITPGFAVPSSLKTPGVRLIKLDCDSSMIKFPEYPTPTFPITPGCTMTPQSQSSSQKDGSCYNRPTDYSSGSSYYKPDESDDIDKNLDVLIKENRIYDICEPGVDPQQNINSNNDHQQLDKNFHDSLDDSSSSSSSSESSSSSSSSNCSSSSSITTAINATNEPHSSKGVGTVADVKKSLAAQRAQHMLTLEQVRLRTMVTLKSDRKIERFRKPKPKLHYPLALRRKRLIENALHAKTTTQPLKVSGNSTPKDSTKAAPKQLAKTAIKPNSKPYITTPSKRKIATPRRVIYLDYNEQLKTHTRSTANYRKQRQSQRLLSEPDDNALLDHSKKVEVSTQLRPVTPSESIAAIENHIAKTGQQSFEECSTRSTETKVDTPKLIQQLQGDANDTLTTPENKSLSQPSIKKADVLVRELFGAMSDSDFMDTPVKIHASTYGTIPVVPVQTKSLSTLSVKDVQAADVNKINSSSAPTVINESDSESGDEYDDCTLISSTCIHTLNRIHETVVSKAIQVPVMSNKNISDLRPLKMFLDDKEITLKTCDEVVLFESTPKFTHPTQDDNSSNKKLIPNNNKKTIKTIQSDKVKVNTVLKVPKISSIPKEISSNSNTLEKSIKFNLVAKRKGPAAELTSNEISSSCQLKRKTSSSSDVKSKPQQNVHSSIKTKELSHHTKIPPLLKDMDINKVLGKIHPSNESS